MYIFVDKTLAIIVPSESFSSKGERHVKSLPQSDVIKIIAKIDTFTEDPRTVGAIKLTANESYRIRQGR